MAAIADWRLYLAGVSTRRVDKLVRTLGVEGISKSEVSRLAATLDAWKRRFEAAPWRTSILTSCSTPWWSRCARAGASATWPRCTPWVSTNTAAGRAWGWT